MTLTPSMSLDFRENLRAYLLACFFNLLAFLNAVLSGLVPSISGKITGLQLPLELQTCIYPRACLTTLIECLQSNCKLNAGNRNSYSSRLDSLQPSPSQYHHHPSVIQTRNPGIILGFCLYVVPFSTASPTKFLRFNLQHALRPFTFLQQTWAQL